MPAYPYLENRIAALRRGDRWLPAELTLRSLGAVLLYACWDLSTVEHRFAIAPDLHPARLADLGLCALIVALLSGGLVLALYGPGVLRDVPLPSYFTQSKGTRR